MFNKFRSRLLFAFGIFVLLIGFTIAANIYYSYRQQELLNLGKTAEQFQKLLLMDYTVQRDFFTYESINSDYFRTGQSEYLETHDSLAEELHRTIDKLYGFSQEGISLDTNLIQTIDKLYVTHEKIFRKIEMLQLKRGFKEFGIVGMMRKKISLLEETGQVSPEQILKIRKYEKDYIIRGEQKYVNKLYEECWNLKSKFENSIKETHLRDSLNYTLYEYQNFFNQLVRINNEIGIKKDEGLISILHKTENKHKLYINKLTRHVRELEKILDKRYKYSYAVFVVILLLISLLVSILLSKRITNPIIGLSQFINSFVSSNFTLKEKFILNNKKDEIAKLADNFGILQTEIISLIDGFKQKVEERTSQLASVNRKLKKTNDTYSLFVPDEFLTQLKLDDITQIKLGSHIQKEMTIFFSDIRAFTTMSEKMTPQENFQFLNTYYSKIGPVIRHHSGFIDKYIGDGIMALFPEVPDDALDAAIEMQRRIRRFNSIFSKRFKFNVKSGIGIHTGSLILGMVGEEKRIDTTVISDAVNLASRMEGLTKIYKNNIIISEETYKKLESPEDYYCRYLDTVQVKGRKNPVTVLEVLNGLSPKILELKIKTKDMYENAISLYMEEETQKAQKLLAEVLKINPYDTPAKLLLQKMEQGDLSCK